MLKEVEKTIARWGMLKSGQTVLCALSGGVDSMAMLSCLKELGYDVCACHFEHGIRGENSLRDMEFVKEYCKENGVRLIIKRGDVPLFAKENSLSLENAARILRYTAMEEAMESFGAQVCATAHHLDDQCETVLMRLIRGAGDGLSGIPYVNGKYIRPLRDVSKAEILEYCREKNIPYIFDETNEDDELPRNLVRNRIVPMMERLNPAASKNIARSMAMMSEDSKFIDTLAAPYIKERISCKEVLGLPEPIRRRVLKGFSEYVGAKNVEHSHIKALEKLADMRTGQRIDLRGVSIINDNGYLRRENAAAEAFFAEIMLGKETKTPLGTFEYIEVPVPENAKTEGSIQYFDLDKIEGLGKVLCRTKADGDRMEPIGNAGSKKLKDIFIDKKIPRDERDRIPVFLAGENIIWAAGVCASRMVCIDEDTKRAAVIRRI